MIFCQAHEFTDENIAKADDIANTDKNNIHSFPNTDYIFATTDDNNTNANEFSPVLVDCQRRIYSQHMIFSPPQMKITPTQIIDFFHQYL